MGTHDAGDLDSTEAQRTFVRRVLEDLQALDLMIAAGAIESGVRRIGAEQEVFLVDRTGAPAPVAMDVIDRRKAPCSAPSWLCSTSRSTFHRSSSTTCASRGWRRRSTRSWPALAIEALPRDVKEAVAAGRGEARPPPP